MDIVTVALRHLEDCLPPGMPDSPEPNAARALIEGLKQWRSMNQMGRVVHMDYETFNERLGLVARDSGWGLE